MSASKLVTIFCDGLRDDGGICGEWAPAPSETAEDSRVLAKRVGWLVGVSGGKDYCPACIAAGKPVAP